MAPASLDKIKSQTLQRGEKLSEAIYKTATFFGKNKGGRRRGKKGFA